MPELTMQTLIDDIKSHGEKRKESTSLTAMLESFESEMDSFSKSIPVFFSTEGEATTLRNILKDVGEDPHDDLLVEAVDVNMATHMYDEYHTGMTTFIHELINIQETEVADYQKKLDTARTNDGLFIESIFGGDGNPSKLESAREAVGTIETLIDFIPKIETYKNQCKALMETAISYGKDEDPMMLEVGKFLFESVSNYTHQSIEKIMSVYNELNHALYDDSTEDIQTKKGIEHYHIW